MAPLDPRSVRINRSVGLAGNNRRADVRAVQDALNTLSPVTRTWLKPDGKNGKKTMSMIYDFQKCVVGLANPDFRVDPGGKTLAKLNDPASKLLWANFAPPPIPPIRSSKRYAGPVARFDRGTMPTVLPPDIPARSSGHLWTNTQAAKVFFPHLKQKEGVVPHFYKCSGGWVTIGVGTLVDRKKDEGNRDKRYRRYVNNLLEQYPTLRFFNQQGQVASKQEVYHDWITVFRGGKGKHAASKRAKLRIQHQEMELAKAQIKYFASALYQHHPFALKLHSHIQMAIIDTRWNSAGKHPWYKTSMSAMWKRLNPDSDQFDPMEALDIFYDEWDDRGKKLYAQYQRRVVWRTERFYEGALAMTTC